MNDFLGNDASYNQYPDYDAINRDELAARLETTTRERDRLLEACERYSEIRCDYIDAIPAACPGILADGIECMACGIRMAVVVVRAARNA